VRWGLYNVTKWTFHLGEFMYISEMYTNGKYLEHNPSWDVEDSPWKADQIHKIIRRNNLKPKNICEIGCGAGEILINLQESMDDSCTFIGYEISPQAYSLCRGKENNSINFKLLDILEEEEDVIFDLILLIDVIEHLEDYFSFLRNIRERSEYKILHIPLEFFAIPTIYSKFTVNQRKNVGHLHIFSKDLSIITLEELDYKVIDWFYTPGFSTGRNYGIKDKLISIPRKLLFPLAPDLTVRIFGGYSLMVLIK
jgi:SAM-dependent methyltransferase